MKRLGFSSLLVASVLSFFVSSSHAQLVPRTVLLEEGTNWSCPPCAAANPGVEAFLQSHGDSIIQIAYHPNWPGADDPMYLNDVSDNQGRVVTYYGISGVPTIEMDGHVVSTSPAAYDSAFYARAAMLSPIALQISRTTDGSTVTVNITLNVVGDVSKYKNLKLRVAGVQRIVEQTGPNGEKHYMNPMRAMMPNLNGTKLTVAQGDTKTFTFSYDINDTYAPEKLYEVAFVQDDNTKEVLQAASTREDFSLAAKASEHPIQILQTQTGSFALQVNNTTGEDLTFTSVYKPIVGTDWNVVASGAPSFTLKNGETNDLPLSITAGTSAYTAGVVIVSTITGRGDTIVNSYPVKFISPSTKFAFVDVSNDSTKSVPTLKALTAMKYRYVPLTDVEANAIQGWSASVFPTMMIEANKWIVTGPNKSALASYLQSGGHVLLHGGEIAYGLADASSTPSDRDSVFLANTLHATYVQDVASTLNVHGVSGDAISDAFASQTIRVDQVNTDQSVQPDVINAVNGATPIFYYGTGTAATAGLRWDDGNAKLVYLAFGLQNLSVTNEKAIVGAVMNWFGTQADVPAKTMPLWSLDISTTSNPVQGLTTISYSVTNDENARVSLVDLRGVELRVLADGFVSSGSHFLSFDASKLTPGTYFLTLRTADGSRTRAVIVE